MNPRLATPPGATGAPAGNPSLPYRQGHLHSNTLAGFPTADIDGGCEGQDARRGLRTQAPGCVNADLTTRVRAIAANPANVDGGGRVSVLPHIIRGFSLRALDFDDPCGCHRAIAPESDNKFLNQFADQSRALFFGRHHAGPLLDFPFHLTEVARAC